jgi:hypothetical protein
MPRLFEQRMMEMALEARKQVEQLGPGPEREALLERARQLDVACRVDEWLSSQKSQPSE